VTTFAALPGRGVVATIGGTDFAIGHVRLLAEYGVPADELASVEARITRHGELGESVLTVIEIAGSSAHVIGTIAVADTVRVNAAQAIWDLHRAGVTSVAMLTGDRLVVAASIAAEAGVDDVRADLLPEDKVTVITALRGRGPVAMVGDGINDGPALAVADVGIAMGIGGSDVALESADIALMRDDLAALPVLRDLATQTVRVIRQNVTLSMVTKVAALLLGALGFVNLWIAVLVDVGTSLIVTFNGLRLARFNAEYSGVADAPLTVAAAACGCDPEYIHDHGEQAELQRPAAD
jgi:Cd2+/Zn2+-exporting ATPase